MRVIRGLRNYRKNSASRLLKWEIARRFVDEYGVFSEPYGASSEGHENYGG